MQKYIHQIDRNLRRKARRTAISKLSRKQNLNERQQQMVSSDVR
jgi:hypothetical protein